MQRWPAIIISIGCLSLGALAANRLVSSLQLTLRTEREILVEQVSQSLKPQTPQTLQLQNAIYEQRVRSLQRKITESEQKTQAVQQYIEPLEQEVTDYRMTFQQQAAATTDERLQLYIDLVQKYRDYNRAMSAIENFIPLQNSDSLLTQPSVPLDLIFAEGGSLATVHNRFVEEPRDSVFASHYEPQLRRFLNQYDLQSTLVECHTTLCGLHLSAVWPEPYYQGFVEIWQALEAEPWMDLKRAEGGHQYRGKGHQVQVWYLEARQ